MTLTEEKCAIALNFIGNEGVNTDLALIEMMQLSKNVIYNVIRTLRAEKKIHIADYDGRKPIYAIGDKPDKVRNVKAERYAADKRRLEAIKADPIRFAKYKQMRKDYEEKVKKKKVVILFNHNYGFDPVTFWVPRRKNSKESA